MYDRELILTVAGSRNSTNWRLQKMKWSELVTRLKTCVRGTETHEEYMRLSRDQQAELKDIGGFVGGKLIGKRRLASAMESRDVISLDMDSIPKGQTKFVLFQADMLGYACVAYSTRKHAPDAPRLRLLFPLKETIPAEQYDPISRKIADAIGIEMCDPTTFEINRLMYWPSASKDGEYVYEVFDGEPIDPQAILDSYGPDEAWKDVARWPVVPGTEAKIANSGKRRGDPEEAKGFVGAWNRVHDVFDALEGALNEVFSPTDDAKRWTYNGGTTHGGAIVHDNGKFLYSYHSTDPGCGQLLNSWELCQLHLFGDLDKNFVGDPQKRYKYPSYKAMVEFAQKDEAVRNELLKVNVAAAQADFASGIEVETTAKPENETEWLQQLQLDEYGKIKPSTENFLLIVRNDPRLKGLRLNTLTGDLEVDPPTSLPWKRENSRYWSERTDGAQCRNWFADVYHITGKEKIDDAIMGTASVRGYDPIIEYLESLPPWDGCTRLETVLIDYLGAENTAYVRAVTVKTFVACVARQYEPGIKFDTILTLIGDQGCGKSTLFGKMGKKWFADTLSMRDTRDKTAAEKLSGRWLMEIGELRGMRDVDDEAIKQFASCQNDVYREAYARSAANHLRRCVLVATTNEESGFLRDTTGGRRWWPVNVKKNGGWAGTVWDMDDDLIDMLWAEALYLYRAGEKLTLDEETQSVAEQQQITLIEQDERAPMVAAYLDRKLPVGWDDMDIGARRAWLSNDFGKNAGTVPRTTVCILEIWCECFGNDMASIERSDSKKIARMLSALPMWSKPGMDNHNRLLVGPYGRQRVYRKRENVLSIGNFGQSSPSANCPVTVHDTVRC